jgi:hypothetical protein
MIESVNEANRSRHGQHAICILIPLALPAESRSHLLRLPSLACGVVRRASVRAHYISSLFLPPLTTNFHTSP